MERQEILNWLKEEDEIKLKNLWKLADDTREKNVGNDVHLRGLIELSNYCIRECTYCGINKTNINLKRYRMNEEELLKAAKLAVELGYGTVVIQSGEDYGIKTEWLSSIIKKIKSETSLALTLSLGERSKSDLIAWKNAGADRYLLKFETSDQSLYQKIHPPIAIDGHYPISRINILKFLKKIGYEAGSGIMIGIYGQTFDILADDIELFAALDLDMIGVGPYIPHPKTYLEQYKEQFIANFCDQVLNTEKMTLKVLALTRIVCPNANIPSTTALETINKDKGRRNGLLCGANVIMPNITPYQYRQLYDIYPEKAGKYDEPLQLDEKIKELIYQIGRTVGQGQGARKKCHRNY